MIALSARTDSQEETMIQILSLIPAAASAAFIFGAMALPSTGPARRRTEV